MTKKTTWRPDTEVVDDDGSVLDDVFMACGRWYVSECVWREGGKWLARDEIKRRGWSVRPYRGEP